LDKDFDWSGEVKDITGFYLFMKTDDNRNITIPNSLVIQRGIEILDNSKDVTFTASPEEFSASNTATSDL